MSQDERALQPDVEEVKAGLRLRIPERQQVAMLMHCVDDLVAKTHPVRMVAGVVAKLDLSKFGEPIKAR